MDKKTIMKMNDNWKDLRLNEAQIFRTKNSKAFTKVYVARGFFDQRFDKNGIKIGPADYSDSAQFIRDAEKEGIQFLILDSHKEIAKNLFATGSVERLVETYNGPQGLFIDEKF